MVTQSATMNSVPIASATPDPRARAPYGSHEMVESSMYSADARPAMRAAGMTAASSARTAANDVDHRRPDLADPAALGLAAFAATTFVLRYAVQPGSSLVHRMQSSDATFEGCCKLRSNPVNAPHADRLSPLAGRRPSRLKPSHSTCWFACSAHNAGWAPDLAWVGLALFYGGLAQLLAGMTPRTALLVEGPDSHHGASFGAA